jgi:hypothetical protein
MLRLAHVGCRRKKGDAAMMKLRIEDIRAVVLGYAVGGKLFQRYNQAARYVYASNGMPIPHNYMQR